MRLPRMRACARVPWATDVAILLRTRCAFGVWKRLAKRGEILDQVAQVAEWKHASHRRHGARRGRLVRDLCLVDVAQYGLAVSGIDGNRKLRIRFTLEGSISYPLTTQLSRRTAHESE